ncbi:MAG: hypothetical protein LBH70_00385 [Spirochaetaceae bacterium]|jgi:hypothetical protein|nr:hypothetical protein [Spirochaetaceae bacterium]
MRIGGVVCRGQALSLVLFGLFTVSCTGRPAFPGRGANREAALLPPATPPLSRSVIGYGVINVSYIHVVSEPSSSGFSLGYLRKSAIVSVLERRAVNNDGVTEFWVLVGDSPRGWLREEVVQIYDNEAKARTAAELLSP